MSLTLLENLPAPRLNKLSKPNFMFACLFKKLRHLYILMKPIVKTILCLSIVWSSTAHAVNTVPTKVTVDLRAGTTLSGDVKELSADSLTLDTQHGEVVLKIRDIKEDCWEKIIAEVPKTSSKRPTTDAPKKKRFVSELIAPDAEDETPDLKRIRLSDVVYQFRKSFQSVNDSSEFIYSPVGVPDTSIAKDNLTIWILDNTAGKTAEEVCKTFLERFAPDSDKFQTQPAVDGTLFFGDRSRDAENNFKFVMGKVFVDGATAWVLVYSRTNSEGELKGWKTDKLETYKDVITNFDDWPVELLTYDQQG